MLHFSLKSDEIKAIHGRLQYVEVYESYKFPGPAVGNGSNKSCCLTVTNYYKCDSSLYKFKNCRLPGFFNQYNTQLKIVYKNGPKYFLCFLSFQR